jgi:hypothetical protein
MLISSPEGAFARRKGERDARLIQEVGQPVGGSALPAAVFFSLCTSAFALGLLLVGEQFERGFD